MKWLDKNHIVLVFFVFLFLSGCTTRTIYVTSSDKPISTNDSLTSTNDSLTSTNHSLLNEVYNAMIPSGNYGQYPSYYFWKDEVTPRYSYTNTRYTTVSTLKDAANQLIKDLRYCVDVNNKNNCEDRFSAVITTQEAADALANIYRSKLGLDFRITQKGSELLIIVTQVFPYSPFSLAGVKRGSRILKVNEFDATQINNENLVKFQFYDKSNFNFEIEHDGMISQVRVDQATFESSDIVNIDDRIDIDKTDRFHPTVLTITNPENDNHTEKIGYMVYRGFGDSTEELKEVLAYWNKERVTNKAIIDLRYNGGGYAKTASDLVNLLTTNYQTSDFVTKLTFNNKYTRHNQTYPLKKTTNVVTLTFTNGTNQSYSPQHDFSELYFLVGSVSASASEMLITSLQPYLKTIVIGETTSGKGVGQSAYRDLTGAYQLWLINFRYVNSRGKGVPTTGLVPNFPISGYATLDYGHGEPLFEKAVAEIFNPTTPINNQLIATTTKKKNPNDEVELDWYKDNFHRLTGF